MNDERNDPDKVPERAFVMGLLEGAAEVFGLTVVVEEQCTAAGGGDAHAQKVALSTNDGGPAESYFNRDGAPQMFVAGTNAPAQKVGMGTGVMVCGVSGWMAWDLVRCRQALKRRSGRASLHSIPTPTPLCAPPYLALHPPQDRRDANPAYLFLRLLHLTDGERRILPDDSAAFLLNHAGWVLWAGWWQLRGGAFGLGCAHCRTSM